MGSREAVLAGLGWSFSPVALPAAQKSERSDTTHQADKAVAFNLQHRSPGAGYGVQRSGGALHPHRPASASQQRQRCQQQQQQLVTAAAGLARLKQASLTRRRAQAQEECFPPGSPSASVGQASEQAEASPPRAEPELQSEQELQLEQEQLLAAAESALAGCSAGPIAQRQASIELPLHLQVGHIPVRPLPLDSVDGEAGLTLRAAVAPSTEAAAATAAPQAAVLPPPVQPLDEEQGVALIAAYRPSGAAAAAAAEDGGLQLALPAEDDLAAAATGEATIERVHALLDAAQLLEPLRLASRGGAPQPPAWSTSIEPPTCLEGALRLLGLLPGGSEASPSSSPRDSSSAAAGVDVCEAAPPALSCLAPPRAKLRAVGLMLAAKRASQRQELLPLVRRLRQAAVHHGFHQANLLSAGRSPPKALAAVQPAAPWVPGQAGGASSKHRLARSSSSPGGKALAPRPKVGPATHEASQLQVRLLSSLLAKLRLKLGLAALRHAAALARLRAQLTVRLAASEADAMALRCLVGWRSAAVPSPQQTEAGAALIARTQRRAQRQQLREWRRWARHRAWQQRQMRQGLHAYHQSLLASALRHWQTYCHQRHLERLQKALASRWLSAWTKRRALAAWRQSARRSALLRQSLLEGRRAEARGAGAAGSSDSGALRSLAPPPTLVQALAGNRAAFGPVKQYVRDASTHLDRLRAGLRFAVAVPAATAGAAEPPVLAGSLSSLLALAEGPRQPPPLQGMQQAVMPPLQAVVPLLCTTAAGAVSLQQQEQQQQQQEVPSIAKALAPPRPPAAAAVAARGGPEAAMAASGPAACPRAGDPRSPAYNPAMYASPSKLQPGDAPAALEAELLECQQAELQAQGELAALEEESRSLQREVTATEAQLSRGQEESTQLAKGAAAAARARDVASAAMQAAAEEQAAAAGECARLKRALSQKERGARDAAGAQAAAVAAQQTTSEVHALASAAVHKWRQKVDAVAKDLAACHRSQQPALLVRLREARQQLEQHQQAAGEAAGALPALQAEARCAARRAERAHEQHAAAERQLVEAAEEQDRAQQRAAAAIERHERAAVAAVAAEQAAAAAEQERRLLSSQQQLRAGRLRQVTQQVLHWRQAVAAMQQQVEQLRRQHKQAIGAVLVAGRLKRRALGSPQSAAATAGSSARPSMVQRAISATTDSPPLRCAREPLAGSSTAPQPVLWGQPWEPPASPQRVPAVPCSSPPEWEQQLAVESEGSPSPPQAGALVLAAPEADGSDWSYVSTPAASPRAQPEPPAKPQTLLGAADLFFRRCRLRHAFASLREQAQQRRLAMLRASERHARRRLATCFAGWRREASQAADWLVGAAVALRARGALRQWRTNAALQAWVRSAEAEADAWRRRRLLRAGLAALRRRVAHQAWRDRAHEAVVLLRMRSMLRWWRAWARLRRMDEARCRRALALHQSRLQRAAWQQWRWLQGSRALLRRVLGTAVELWRQEVGVLLHARNFEALRRAFGAWKLFVLQQQEERRQAILRNAAVAFREKQLLLAGLAAFGAGVAEAAERRRLARLASCMWREWRRVAAASPRHWGCEAARHHRRRWLLRQALRAWRGAVDETAYTLSRFWMRWQVNAPLRRALLGWRAAARCLRHAAQQQALADAARRVALQRRALAALWQGTQLQREERVGEGMADVHRDRQLERKAWLVLRANAAAAAGAARSVRPVRQPAGGGRAARGAGPAAATAQQRGRSQEGGGAQPMESTTVICYARTLPRPTGPEQQQQRAPHLQQHRPPPQQRQPQQPLAAPPLPAASGSLSVAIQGWQDAAARWRARQQVYEAARRGPGPPPAQPAAAAADPHAAACLGRLRSQW
eukprot:scaffold3.g6536.t1